MLKIDIEVPDLNKFNLDINLDEILDGAAAFLISRVLSRFLAENGPDGTPWIPSRAGMARRLKGGTGTLYDTGRLFRSIQVHRDSEGQRRISTDVPYATLMQRGGGPFNLPPRPFLGFNQQDESMVKQIVNLRISEMLK